MLVFRRIAVQDLCGVFNVDNNGEMSCKGELKFAGSGLWGDDVIVEVGVAPATVYTPE